MSKLITPYILEKEYRCRCCRKLPPDFYVDGADLFEHRLEYLIERVASNVRMGIYKGERTFIHIDVGYIIQPRALDEWHKRARWRNEKP